MTTNPQAQQLLDEWREYLEDYNTALADVVDFKDLISTYGRRLAEIRDEIIANGGLGVEVIDGKNAETRAAQLECMLATHKTYQSLHEGYEQSRHKLARAEGARDTAAENIRRCRVTLEYLASENHLTAAIGAPPPKPVRRDTLPPGYNPYKAPKGDPQ